MWKIKESINTWISAKKQGRTYEQQKYRNDLAKNLKNTRAHGDAWKELAWTLLEKEKSGIRYVESFGEDKKAGKEIAIRLIKEWEWEYVGENIKKFKWVDHKEIAIELINRAQWEYVGENIKKFECDHKEIAIELIRSKIIRQWRAVERYLKNFKWLDHKEIAIELIKAEQWEDVGIYIDNFKCLDKEVAKELTKAWYGGVVLKHPEKFWLKKEK